MPALWGHLISSPPIRGMDTRRRGPMAGRVQSGLVGAARCDALPRTLVAHRVEHRALAKGNVVAGDSRTRRGTEARALGGTARRCAVPRAVLPGWSLEVTGWQWPTSEDGTLAGTAVGRLEGQRGTTLCLRSRPRSVTGARPSPKQSSVQPYAEILVKRRPKCVLQHRSGCLRRPQRSPRTCRDLFRHPPMAGPGRLNFLPPDSATGAAFGLADAGLTYSRAFANLGLG